MTRSVQSRIQQYRRGGSGATNGKRKGKSHSEDGSEQSTRHKKQKQLSASVLEQTGSAERLRQLEETKSRNSTNQLQSVRATRAGLCDEERFFAEIDKPMSKVCGVCGELSDPDAIRMYPYRAHDRRFTILAVKRDGRFERGLVEAGVTTVGSVESVAICRRCDQCLARSQVPKFSQASGFQITSVPECLATLNPMEARMIGLGVCFTTCFRLGYLGQSATRGNSINFWNNAYDIVAKLPRPPTRCGVIRLKQAGTSLSDTYYHVRPWLLREALLWLIHNNPIYSHVVIDEELLQSLPATADVPSVELEPEDSDATPIDEVDESAITDEDGAFSETFVLEHPCDEQREDESILEMLRGDHEEEAFMPPSDRPMNEYSTKLLMQCCFPTLFPHGLGGFHPIDNIEARKHTYQLAEYCSHLMSWHDRRYITHPTFKFFCLNIIQRRQIDGLLKQIGHRGDTSNDDDSTCAETHETSEPGQSTNHNVSKYLKDLRPYFRSVRGTGLYWANVRDELMSMIGDPAMETRWPTFFVTLSAADTVWPDFFRVCDPTLSFDEAGALSPARKRSYLNDNPDLAARHFHRRFQAFYRHILCGKSKPLGEIDAPDILELSKSPEGRAQLSSFADKFVSCLRRLQSSPSTPILAKDPLCTRPPPKTSPARDDDLGAVVERVQLHTCTSRSSCQRKGQCRFGFPKQLQSETSIVREVNKGEVRVRFEHQRDHDGVNNYNPAMLSCWRANMDIKIIGNAYGAAEYTAAYVSKAEPDSIRFRRSIEVALSKLPNGVPYERVLKRTATATLAIREVSAQEAVYILSRTLCLTGKSRTVLRVKVSRHDRRYYRVRLDANGAIRPNPTTTSGAVVEAIEKAYMQRPNSPAFNELPYREFCELYEVSNGSPTSGQLLERWALLNGAGYIKARKRKQIVRPSPRYRKNEQDGDFCYAQLLLHKPWRQLSDIPITDEEVCAAYARWKSDGRSAWVAHITDTIERERVIEANKSSDIVLPGPRWSITVPDDAHLTTAGNSEITIGPTTTCFESRFHYSPQDIARARRFLQDVVRPHAIAQKVPSAAAGSQRLPYMYPTESQPSSLTDDQWRPFSIWMHQSRLRYAALAHRSECAPIRMVVSGEGGTGKSWLIRHIQHDIQVVFGSASSYKRVLLMAHQGSAAHLIGGCTLVSGLGLPSKTGSVFRCDYTPLVATPGGQSTLRRLQHEYEHVHLVIVDEFSVVSCGMMYWIDQQLREIFPGQRHLPFGGRDILFTGDPGQLGPVSCNPLTTPKALLHSEAEVEGRNTWIMIEHYFILRQQNRGIADIEWYDMLRRVRDGNACENDLTLINSRVVQPPAHQLNIPVYIAYRNIDVDEANNWALRELDRPLCSIHAGHDVQLFDSRPGEAAIDEETQRVLLEEAKLMTPASAKYLPVRLDLALGAPIVLTFNIEQRAGLCNGSRGIVYDIIPDDHTDAHQPIVLVQLKDYKGPSFIPNVSGIVPVVSRTVNLTTKRDGPHRLTRTALPLRLGFATTIHKIQGQTCDQVVFNPTNLKTSSLAYVALSRVRDRSDIFIRAPLTLKQLAKSDQMRLMDDAERERVMVIETRSNRTATQLLPLMKLLAENHNTRTSILTQHM